MDFKLKYRFIFYLYVLFFSFNCFSQDQAEADRLYKIYQADTVVGVEKLQLLNNLAFNENADYDKALFFAEELITLAIEMEDSLYLQSAYLQKGNKLKDRGNLQAALDAFQKCAIISSNIDFEEGEGSSLMTIAGIYANLDDVDSAIEYFNKTIDHYKSRDELSTKQDSIHYAAALFNFSNFYLDQGFYTQTIDYLNDAEKIFLDIGDVAKQYQYYVTGNRGIYHSRIGNPENANIYLKQAIDGLLEYEDYSAATTYLNELAKVNIMEGEFGLARNHAKRGLNYSFKLGLAPQISESSLVMAKLDSIDGNFKSAFNHLNNYLTYKERLFSEDKLWNIAKSERNFVVAQKDTIIDSLNRDIELGALKNQRTRFVMYGTLALLLFIAVLAIGYFRRYRYIKKTKAIIEGEMDRSDKLLLNILPKESAKELKINGKVQANRYESVTVMFTDFADFTSHAEGLNPELLVQSVDYYFSYFDDIMDNYGLEKIKTLGDSYMCAGGLPFISPDHTHKMVEASRDILDFVEKVYNDETIDIIKFKIRIGINTGPVIAGIVGKKKFAYDIWGDTVNIASRMESNSEAGKINISEYTYNLIKYDYDCEFRGSIEVKNRGKMNMYFVGKPK